MSEPVAETTPAPSVGDPPEGRRDGIEALSYQDCPVCTTGILIVVGYDEAATHEVGQAGDKVVFEPSGGAAHRHCFLCGYHESLPLSGLGPQAAEPAGGEG